MNFPSLQSTSQYFRRRQWLGTTLLTGIMMAGCAPGPSLETRHDDISQLPQATKHQTPENFPDNISDPLEPVNRGIGKVNEKLLLGVIRPTTSVYRTIAPPPARKSVSHFSRNITYPVRLVNNMLQGRWKGAGDESLRFLTNTTVGVAGFLDPASRWNIPKSDASSAQTFYKWGWKPNNFVMLPVLGPSDDLHVAGRVGDKALEPWTYYENLSPLSGAITFNRLADQTETIVQFIQTEADPYVGSKYIWTYTSKHDPPNWALNGPQDLPSLHTINAATIRSDDPEFALKGRRGSVRLPSTGKKMKFNYWFQKQPAPLVYIMPGLGAHRLSPYTLVVAENLYQNGYSVVTTVGTFHPEFMENAATTAIPAYPPIDSQDMLVYLTEINKSLEKKHPGRFGKRALIGISLGGFHALHLAANEEQTNPELLRFDRYVAMNPPVNLLFSNKQLDNYFRAPLEWPSSKRQERINNTVHKAALFPFLPEEQRKNPLFDGIESKYIIGLTFRAVLRDSIYSSQSRHNMGIIKTPLKNWRRDAAYNEIAQYSFEDYLTKFALPYHKKNGISRSDFYRESNLRSYRNALRADQRLRVITNKNDFILSSKDVSWLRSTFGTSRLTLLPNGGHIGNVATPLVEKATLKSLEGLK